MAERQPQITPDMLRQFMDHAEAVDRGERTLAADVDALRSAGLLTAPLPRALGGCDWSGNGMGMRGLFDALVALGGASLPLARLFEGHADALSLVMRIGTRDQQTAVAAAVRDGVLFGVWGACGARSAEANVAGSGWRLTGEKRFCSGLGMVGQAVVTARLENASTQLFIVDVTSADRHDLGDWDVIAMHGSLSGRMDLDGMMLEDAAALGTPDMFVAEPHFHGGLWRIAAMQSGALERLAALHRDMTMTEPPNPLKLHRHGSITVEAGTARLWSRYAMETMTAPDVTYGGQRAALLAREAVEQAATRALALMERDFGTGPHRRGSEAGRIMRDLRFHIRQADPDGKLAYAVQLGSEPVV